jgi:hypothetical protein
MKYLKRFESTDWNSENNFVSDLEDITLELKDEGMLVDVNILGNEYAIVISKPGLMTAGNKLIEWSEIKDTVIRLTEYCYENGWSVRFWGDGREFLTGCKKEEDFTIGDGITQFSFRMLITRL